MSSDAFKYWFEEGLLFGGLFFLGLSVIKFLVPGFRQGLTLSAVLGFVALAAWSNSDELLEGLQEDNGDGEKEVFDAEIVDE